LHRHPVSEHPRERRRDHGQFAGHERSQFVDAALADPESVGDGRLGLPAERLWQPDVDYSSDDVARRGCACGPVLEESREARMKRREFITLPAKTVAGLLVFTV